MVLRCFATACIAALAIAGCGPSGPLVPGPIQIGRTVNSDESVGTIAMRFKRGETIYAALLTEGPGAGTVKARWSFRGATISEEEKSVSYTEGAATGFRLQYAGGLPPGDYKLELSVDGTLAGSRDFVVEP